MGIVGAFAADGDDRAGADIGIGGADGAGTGDMGQRHRGRARDGKAVGGLAAALIALKVHRHGDGLGAVHIMGDDTAPGRTGSAAAVNIIICIQLADGHIVGTGEAVHGLKGLAGGGDSAI